MPFSGVGRNEIVPADPSRARSRPNIVSTDGGLSPANLGFLDAARAAWEDASRPAGGSTWRVPGSMSCARAAAGVKSAARTIKIGNSRNSRSVWIDRPSKISGQCASHKLSRIAAESRQVYRSRLPVDEALQATPGRRGNTAGPRQLAQTFVLRAPLAPYIRLILRLCVAIPI
jgi:hypothetical protein